jgi:hypothetical protein
LPKIIVQVMPKQDLLDPQGKAVARALERSGHKAISAVRIGKRIDFTTQLLQQMPNFKKPRRLPKASYPTVLLKT